MEIKIEADQVLLFKAILYSIGQFCKTEEDPLIETSAVVEGARKYMLAK